MNESATSYEDIPGISVLKHNSASDVMAETNRGAVMQALQNLQEKIQRLELERSGAESDMRHLATETARFRQLLTKKDEPPERYVDKLKKMDMIMNHQTDESSKDALSPKRQLLTSDFHPSVSINAMENRVPESPATPWKSHDVSLATSKAQEMALASAETRCTILEKQLAYMRTLLESAERDKNEAQRRSRSRNEQLTTWRQKAEVHLRGMEEELRAERQKNRRLCDNTAQTESQQQIGSKWRKAEDEVYESRLESDDMGRQDSWDFPNPRQNEGLLIASTPRTKVKEVAVSKRQGAPVSRRPPRQDRAVKGATNNVPFVVGRSTAPSHNVNANLQTVLGMLSKQGTPSEKVLPSKQQRQTRNEQVDRQMREDVRVVLEELVEEFDQLCREHHDLVHRLAKATELSEKSLLEQGLSDIVNKMEVKGQQIGRLRSYMVNIGANDSTNDNSNSKVEIRTTIETQPSLQTNVSTTRQTPGLDRRERSLQLLKNAKQWQACHLEPKDVSWR